ncbi:hypothetical protein [Nonomuraea sp. SYSU D8015]|uniref:hypothetical protein n=1 Tax=Nonomuraea sp. SYSU D8015 TaxID=2593644 RepID=UPI001660BE1E|nr:hypothetical protein [Nonomuraea sp. SYSU D8015]
MDEEQWILEYTDHGVFWREDAGESRRQALAYADFLMVERGASLARLLRPDGTVELEDKALDEAAFNSGE